MGVAILNHFQNMSNGPFKNIEAFYSASDSSYPGVTLKTEHKYAMTMVSFGSNKSSSVKYDPIPSGFILLTAGDTNRDLSRGYDIRTGSNSGWNFYSAQYVKIMFTGTKISTTGNGAPNTSVISGFAFD